MLTKKDVAKVFQERVGKHNYDLKRAECEFLVTEVIEAMKDCAVEDGLNLIGFVKFEKVHKEERKARNPMNGQTVTVPEKTILKAKISKTFKEIDA